MAKVVIPDETDAEKETRKAKCVALLGVLEAALSSPEEAVGAGVLLEPLRAAKSKVEAEMASLSPPIKVDTRTPVQKASSLEFWSAREAKRIQAQETDIENQRGELTDRLCALEERATELQEKTVAHYKAKLLELDALRVEIQRAPAPESVTEAATKEESEKDKEIALLRLIQAGTDAEGVKIPPARLKVLRQEADELHGLIEEKAAKRQRAGGEERDADMTPLVHPTAAAGRS